MGVKRRVNWLSQQRVDTPDMRAVESAVSNDFDELVQSLVTNTGNSYVVRGFEISMAGAIGGASSGLQMIVDPGALLHTQSSQSGTFYLVPSGTSAQPLNSATNTVVDGAFAPSAINYVGIEYERFIDDTTSSQVYLWNPTTKNETTKNAPRATILRYRIKISTSTPANTVLPICTVLTDSGNNVVSITDARPLLGRLGTGGFAGDPFYTYAWPEGRAENPSTSSSNSVSPFDGGDKAIGSLKEWMDAVMTAVKEIKGTTYWYSLSSSGSLESLREDLGNTVITGRGTITHSDQTAGLLTWSDDINIRVIGSRLMYTLAGNPASTDITLGDDQAAYVTLVRGITIVPNLIFTNGSAVVTSVGAIAWTGPLQSGDWVKVGSETDSGYYRILTVNSSTQVTFTTTFTGTSTGATGTKAKYAFGTYTTSPSPSTNRHIYIANRNEVPQGEDVFWLYLRSDNGGVIPRIYIRFLGAEIQQGESEDISDNTSLELLEYIGSPLESASKPQYVSALDPGSVAEVVDFIFPPGSVIVNNQYFFINSSSNSRMYYAWFNKNGTGTDPMVGTNGIEIAILTADSPAQVAAKVATALNNTTFPDFLAVQKAIPNTDTVRVTNTSAGTCTAPSTIIPNITIAVITAGTGTGNKIINDGDNLTLSIKRLDMAYGEIVAALDDPSYDEAVDIVALTPSGTDLTIPLNTRMGNVQQFFTVGKATLQFYVNGQYQRLGLDYTEVGSSGSVSSSITLLRDLVDGDSIEFRTSGVGAGGAGGGGVGPEGPEGPEGPAGADAIGGPVAISTKTSNYSVSTSDNVLLADCTSGSIQFDLPAAASAVGQVFFFKKIDSSGNAMVIQAFAAETIDGVTNQMTAVQYETFTLVTDGSAWYII